MDHMTLLLAGPWALHPASAEEYRDIILHHRGDPAGKEVAARIREASEADFKAMLVAGYQRLDDDSRVLVKDGVGVIRVRGPLMRHAGLFAQMSGVASMEGIANDVGAAMQSMRVHSVVLDIDSPGGHVNGTAELAGIVRGYSAKKPVVAYVAGMGCSAAYWIASAAPRVVADPTAMIGSIGVLMGFRAKSESEKREITIVSSNAPNKIMDPETEPGRAEAQRIVDRTEREFVGAVAKYRGVSTDKVLSDFGRGGVFIGSDAVDSGMADGVGSLEGVIAELAEARRRGVATGRIAAGSISMAGEHDSKDTTPAALPAAPIDAHAPTRAEMDALRAELLAERTARFEAQADAFLAANATRLNEDQVAKARDVMSLAFADDSASPIAGKSRLGAFRAFVATMPEGQRDREKLAGRPATPAAAIKEAADRSTAGAGDEGFGGLEAAVGAASKMLNSNNRAPAAR